MDELVCKKDVLKILGISMNTLDLLMKNKRLPYIKLGNGKSSGVRFFKKDIENFINQRIK